MDLALTADLGNTRLKLCAWRFADGALVARRALEAGESIERGIAEFARAHGPFARSALSSVATRAREDEAAAALARDGGRVSIAPESGLAFDVREPARVGRDRVYAARGALELDVPRDAGLVVVDAGTALTVDALDARAGGRFLGGAIAPGPALLARALHEHTARLPLVEPAANAPALGRDTEAALRAGVVVGFRGAALELARAIAREAGWSAPHVVVTGGARALLLEPELFDRASFASVREDGDLVDRGLLAALRAAARTSP